IALGFGAYFLRNYLELLAIGAVLAYLFNPAYQRLRARTNAGVGGGGDLCAGHGRRAGPGRRDRSAGVGELVDGLRRLPE
ncbi:AI-2E family transporter, partial [Mycolicibacterium insubricum]|nr:AI-2E family transporter [Mycolicibacterium insubricum]